MLEQNTGEAGEEKLFSKRRIRNIILGAIGAVVVGLLLVNTFTYVQYGGTMFDKYLKKEKKSPAAGKFAYTKGTNFYQGIIRDEGTSPSKGKVYYIEQAGGSMIEVSKDLIEAREPEKSNK
jgi:hypothetical protein